VSFLTSTVTWQNNVPATVTWQNNSSVTVAWSNLVASAIPEFPNPRGPLFLSAFLFTQALGTPATLTQFSYYSQRPPLQTRIERTPQYGAALGHVDAKTISMALQVPVARVPLQTRIERTPQHSDALGFVAAAPTALITQASFTYETRQPLQVQRNDNTLWPRNLYTWAPPIALTLKSPAGVLTPYQADLPPRAVNSYFNLTQVSQNLQLTLLYVPPNPIGLILAQQWFEPPPFAYRSTPHLISQPLNNTVYGKQAFINYTDLWIYISQLINSGLQVTPSVEWITDPVVPYGKVIATIPVGGTSVLQWTYVTIQASLGPAIGVATITVPNVVGQQVYTAEQVCWSTGLDVGQRVYVQNGSATPMTVTAQSLTPGTSVIGGTQIQLTVAIAPAPGSVYVTVPKIALKWTADATTPTADSTFYTADVT